MPSLNRPFFRQAALGLVALIVLIALGGLGFAQADDDGDNAREKTRPHAQTPLLPLYKQECAACHLAYPPRLLPAPSWQRLMDNLPEHFGTDASLEPDQVLALSRWLTANAATSKRHVQEPPQDRITRSAWFVREHDEVSPATWKRASIKSAANCMACHTQADQGNYNERYIRIPK
jgi:Dihaem cytochrome c